VGEDTPLSECLLGIYQDHYARDGRAAEHLCIELDERDLDDWIDRARALEAEVARLRAELVARPVVTRLFNRATYDELGEDEW
jgi:hypothetical protein